MLDISDFPTRHPYGLGLWQNRMEPILAGWIDELGVPVHRGREVVGFVQDETGVDVDLAEGGTAQAKYLVGADGGRSVIRKAAGIDFPGWDATRSNLIAEVEVAEEPPSGMRQDETGVHGFTLMADGRTYRVITTEQQLGPAEEPSLTDLSNALNAVYGTDFGVHSPTWISRFTDATRQAADLPQGAGAARRGRRAHPLSRRRSRDRPRHPGRRQPGVEARTGGQGHLTRVPPGHLSCGAASRRCPGAQALDGADSPAAHGRTDRGTRRDVDELMSMDQPRRLLAALIHGLDITYDLGEGHPLLGRRMPDLDLDTADGPTRVFTLLHDAKPVLLDLGEPDRIDSDPGPSGSGWSTPVRRRVHCPLLGEVTPPSAVLIRPDGHVAWVGQGTNGADGRAHPWFGR